MLEDLLFIIITYTKNGVNDLHIKNIRQILIKFILNCLETRRLLWYN